VGTPKIVLKGPSVLRVWGHAPQLSEIMSLARYSPSTRKFTNNRILARLRLNDNLKSVFCAQFNDKIWMFGKVAQMVRAADS
jgi:hypothetical protein